MRCTVFYFVVIFVTVFTVCLCFRKHMSVLCYILGVLERSVSRWKDMGTCDLRTGLSLMSNYSLHVVLCWARMCVAFGSVIHLVVVSAHMFHFDVCLSYISKLAFDFIVAVWSKLPPCSNRIMDEYYVQIEKYMYYLSYIITDYFRKLLLLCTSYSDVVFFLFPRTGWILRSWNSKLYEKV